MAHVDNHSLPYRESWLFQHVDKSLMALSLAHSAPSSKFNSQLTHFSSPGEEWVEMAAWNWKWYSTSLSSMETGNKMFVFLTFCDRIKTQISCWRDVVEWWLWLFSLLDPPQCLWEAIFSTTDPRGRVRC